MKKTFVLPIALAFVSLALSSCVFDTVTNVFLYNKYVSDTDKHETISEDGYYKLGNYASTNYYDYNGTLQEAKDYSDVYRSKSTVNNYKSSMRADLTSNGVTKVDAQKILVIPVEFSDCRFSDVAQSTSVASMNITNAFFGDPSVTLWESLASYYNKTSNGKLRIKGKVSANFTYSKTSEEIKSQSRYSSRDIANEAAEWYKSHYSDINSFDQDGDGKIDCLYLIYSAPYVSKQENPNSIFWAYTSFITNSPSSIVGGYVFCSYSFFNVKKNYTDARTIIHEFGHILGLQDYYNTINNSIGPCGKFDMMDFSIGDHSAFSKMLLSWTRPYVVTDDCVIDLKPFESSGDCIIIPAGTWNNTPFDEYILLEFYTPSELNQMGANSYLSYVDNDGVNKLYQLPNGSGIKVSHVDARLGYFNVSSVGSESFVSLLENTPSMGAGSHIINLAYSNDSSTHPLYHILESSGNETFISSGNSASNETLFHEGDSFGVDTFDNYSFYRGGQKVGFSFEVQELTNFSAKISFTKK